MRTEPDDLASAGVGTRRLERALGSLVGVFGLIFALQTFDSLWADRASLASPGGAVIVVLIAVSVTAAAIAGLLQLWVRPVLTGAFLCYVVALVLWPLVLVGRDPGDGMPWLVSIWCTYIAYLATALRRVTLPLVASVALPAAMAAVLVRTDHLRLGATLQDAGASAVLGLLLTAVVALVRRSVASSERAQHAALVRFSAMRTGRATEQERVRTDALVHDSVLTCFLSAAAAATPEDEALAARMAARALRVLDRLATPGREEPRITVAEAMRRARAELDSVADAFEIRVGDDDALLPESAAEAMVSATVQAMVNSVKHAGEGAHRSVEVRREPDALRIEVRDDGRGFDPGTVDSERLGVRVSILERVRLAGGRAEVHAAPGLGVAVVLRYPLDDASVVAAELAVPA